MSKHEETYVDENQPYEPNIIGMKGIIYFGIGLFLLIVITFGLMWVFQYQVLQPDWNQADKDNTDPMAMSKKERIPKNLQLQSAPGFGVDTPDGRINLELREPQAEYRVLKEVWEKQLKEGEKDEKTDTVISLPINDAKEKLLADKSLKAISGEDGEKAFTEASTRISAASSGRKASVKIR